MKKKLIIPVLLGTTTALLSLGSCSEPLEGLDLLNNKLKKSYGEITVTVRSEFKDRSEVLISIYKITNLEEEVESYKVDSSIQQFANIDLESGVLPESPIETIKDSKTYEGTFSLERFNLKSTYFSYSDLDDEKFVGNITNAKYFFNVSYNMNNTNLEIKFDEKKVNEINYDYVLDNGTKSVVKYVII